MRLSLDIDSDSLFPLFFSIFKQFIFTRRFPDELIKTRKGYHLVTHGLGIGEERCRILRALCGDDINRVRYDCDPFRFNQVLFDHKICFVNQRGWKKLTYCRSCKMPLFKKRDEKRGLCRYCKNIPYRAMAIRIRRLNFLNRFFDVKVIQNAL